MVQGSKFRGGDELSDDKAAFVVKTTRAR